MVRITDQPDLTSAVYHGCLARNKKIKNEKYFSTPYTRGYQKVRALML